MKNGFERILDDLQEYLRGGVSLHAAMDRMVTLGNRFAPELGIQALTPLQVAVLEQASDLAVEFDLEPRTSPARVRWYLGIWNHGRPWLATEAPTHAECRPLGSVALTAAMHEAALHRAREIAWTWSACDDQMNAFYAQLDSAGVRHVLYEVHEAVDHTDPVLLYIGDTTLTNFGKFNNLQERNGADLPQCFFRRAQNLPPSQWTRDERIFVFCFYWLRTAGCRGEEFCGRQLNPALLDACFDQRLREYRQDLPAAASIEAKARRLAQCKARQCGEVLTWRWINGLNFCKEERLLQRDSLLTGMAALPKDLRAYLAQHHDIHAGAFGSLASLADACIEHIAAGGCTADASGMNELERLLKAIVDSAIAATGSDAGMTRGFRDLARFRHALTERRYTDICDWPSTDYFCGVFPSAAMFEQLAHAPQTLIKILYACSGRMQFNAWHYMPAHVPRDQVPPDRHFYLAPRMPDIAIWSDQHHAGHVHASVRHSIRSPAPLEINNTMYQGMVDLRLFRQRGAAYTEAELRTALAYTEVLRAFWQAAVDFMARTSVPLRIEAFTKEWFFDYYSAQCASHAAHIAAPPAPCPMRQPDASAGLLHPPPSQPKKQINNT